MDNIRRPKTGGGPPPALMTPAEETLYQAMDSRPNIVGLIGGIDSDGNNLLFPAGRKGWIREVTVRHIKIV